jgi:uncharacterized protein (DUF1330 family)
MRVLIASVLLLCSSMVYAQVVDVDIWEPMPGMGEKTVEYAKEAEKIVKSLGGNAMVGQERDGSVHFASEYKNWTAWAAFQKKLSSSKAWGSFVAKFSANPSATLSKNYLLNTPSPGKDGPVYQVFVWHAELGRGTDLIQSAMKAKAIHQKDGAAVTIHIDQMQDMHYVMNFDSWEAWAKFQDSPHPEFQAFMQQQSKDSTGSLIEVYTASMR